MFTINIYLRFALIAFGIIGGVAMSALLGFWYGFLFIVMGIALLVGYFLLGTVQSAATLMQMQDFEGAEARLDLTKKPEWLYEPSQAIFYMLKGMIRMQGKDFETGEKMLLKAASFKALGDNELAGIYMQLASIYANKMNWNQAQAYYNKAKTYKVTEPMIKEQLQLLEKALAQRGQMKNSMMGAGFRQFGGKRRMPKAR
jgi:tetratricopeptide (TPR) repeat protein